MKAIILAAGRGSRMAEETANKPKCMTVLFDKTLIERAVETLIRAGFNSNDIGIVTGYKKELIQIPNVTYFHNENWETTNMFISLTQASNWLKTEDCIMVYSDIIFHEDVIKKVIASSGNIVIPYYTDYWKLWSLRFENPLEDLETFKFDGEHLIEIGNKPQIKEEVMGQYMGIIKFTPKGWEQVLEVIKNPLKKPIEKLDMTTLLQHLILQNYEITTFQTSEPWFECDNMNDVKVYESNFKL